MTWPWLAEALLLLFKTFLLVLAAVQLQRCSVPVVDCRLGWAGLGWAGLAGLAGLGEGN